MGSAWCPIRPAVTDFLFEVAAVGGHEAAGEGGKPSLYGKRAGSADQISGARTIAELSPTRPNLESTQRPATRYRGPTRMEGFLD